MFYITSSIYIIIIMRWIYPRTREKEMAWKMGAIVALGSLLLSPFAMLIFEGGHWGLQTVRSLISDDRSLDADLIFY